MNQVRVLKAVILVITSLFVSGCMMDMAGSSTPDTSKTTAMSEADKASQPVKVAGGSPLGGYIEQFMDANDKSKMTRALDGGLGKPIRWKNPVSGAEFAVTPLSKASTNGGICRTYSVTMTKTGIDDKVSGTACIGEDGVWHAA